MPNTSATGGFLVPIGTSGELNDSQLADFLQALVVGVTGLPAVNVRPRWQSEPPTWPTYGTNWAAIAVVHRRPDKFAHVTHRVTAGQQTQDGFDEVYRQEILEILCSFYGPNSETNAELLSMGLQVYQNLEQIELSGLGLIEVDDMLSLGELIHERYTYRVDLGFKLRRAQIYQYPVLNVLNAQATVNTDQGLPSLPLTVTFRTVLRGPLFTWDISGAEFLNGWDSGSWS